MNKTHKNYPTRGIFPEAAPVAHHRLPGLLLLLLLLLLALMACDDDFYTIRWEESPDTAQIYSLARPELNLYSGFDFLGRKGVQIESPAAVNGWDMVLDTQDGELVFVPPKAIGVTTSTAAIAPMGIMAFEDLKRAPSDTAMYIDDRPVQVNVGELYVIRSRRAPGSYGSPCDYYGKFLPLIEDIEAETVTFMFDISPVCNDRKLVPPKD
jgi:hypothetical protein